MKKHFILLLAFSAFLSVSCAKNILPETDQSIEGRWAHVIDGIYADYYLQFEMGKCYTYTPAAVHIFYDNAIWGCQPGDYRLSYSEYYAIKEGCLQVSSTQDGFDAVNLGRMSVNGDILAIGDVVYSRLSLLTSRPSPLEAIVSVKITPSDLTLIPGEVRVLTAEVSPDLLSLVPLVWKSDNPQVVFVDDFGRVKAVSSGSANVMAQASNGVYGICKITVKATVE